MNSAAVLEALVSFARPYILERYRAESCIASTSIGIQVLKYFGIRGLPRQVTFAVFNEEAWNLLNTMQSAELLKAQCLMSGKDEPGGPWVLGTDNLEGFGHLVIEAEGHLIDLSLDQATRKHKGIELEPIVLEAPPGWTRLLTRVRGCTVTYLPDDRGEDWTTSPNWNDPRDKQVIGKIIRSMK